MAEKERNQNPVVGDTINLRLITYNSNNYQNVQEIEKVEIYVLDPTDRTCTDPCGKRLVETIDASSVTLDSTGNYLLPLVTTAPTYVIGRYQDVWSVVFKENEPASTITNNFTIYPDLWYTATIPAVYGFSFHFQPNRIRQGSKKWLIIRIDPNVPRATDLERYYTNLAISSNLRIWIEQNCGPCTPTEEDLRLIVDGELVSVRDKVFAFYFLDTSEMDCGIYNVWFELQYAGATEVSPKMQFQIF